MQVMPGDDEGEHQRRAGAVVRGDAGEHEDAGADDGADAEAGELHRAEDAAQAVFAAHLFEQEAERLSGKQLALISHVHLSLNVSARAHSRCRHSAPARRDHTR